MILAPLRGVTVRRFRRTFGAIAAECGFTEAVAPFVAAMRGVDPLKDPELKPGGDDGPLETTPQLIGKDPAALRDALLRLRDAGYARVDLNCGCPFPMVRKKGRGSGLLKTPDVLARMLETGCETMGPGNFSAKTRLGLESPRELAALMPVFNSFPLARLAIHARTAAQMYSGECDREAFLEAYSAARMPVVYNGDVETGAGGCERPAWLPAEAGIMAGRGFVRHLGRREDSPLLLGNYIRDSLRDGMQSGAVLGRMKELACYWTDVPRWAEFWRRAKKERTLAGFERLI